MRKHSASAMSWEAVHFSGTARRQRKQAFPFGKLRSG